MILGFADGFTSSTAPVFAGGGLIESLPITNNATSASLITFNKAIYKTIFAEYELLRSDVGGVYIQQGTMIFANDGTNWSLQLGNYVGVDMIAESIVTPEQIIISINATTGVVTYNSGNMGASYVGSLKLNITRIAV